MLIFNYYLAIVERQGHHILTYLFLGLLLGVWKHPGNPVFNIQVYAPIFGENTSSYKFL